MDKKNEGILKAYLNKISVCLYIIIGLLSVILIVQLATGGITKKDTTKKDEITETEYDVSMFNSIDATAFMSLLEDKEASLIYFGRETCTFCVQFLPVLQQAQTDLGYQMNYIDVSEIDTTTDDFESMIKIYDDMLDTYNEKNNSDYEELYGYTPAVLIVQDGKIKDIWIGYGNYDSYVEWLSENGIK